MSKKFIICLALILAMGVPAYADVVFGNWENTSGDGWTNNGTAFTLPGTVGNLAVAQSTIGVTNGSHSLAATVNASGYQGNILKKPNYTNSGAPDYSGYFTMAQVLANTQFKIDITYDSGSWPSNMSYAQVYEASMQGSVYPWSDVGGANDHTGKNGVVFSDTLNPGYTGGLPNTNAGTPGTVMTGTWTWDYSAILPGGSWSGNHLSTADTYFNLIFALNSNVSGGTYYFDNARLVPEPATIALLGLGGLALIRRKR